MKELIGPSNRILEIDLSKEAVDEITVSSEMRELYLGGKGLALKLLYDRMKPKIDPLSSNNYLAFVMGPLLGTGAPCSGRFAIVSKSPLTKLYSASSCGGPFGMALKTAGYDGILITGKANRPIYLEVTSEGVTFNDASSLWGKKTFATQDELKITKKDGAVVIGPAGEKLVWIANIVSGYRFAGRGGLGTIMGSKNLKAIVARGKVYKIKPVKPKKFRKVMKTSLKRINRNKFTSFEYRDFGTNSHVKYSNKYGLLPVRNFQDGSHEKALDISGETMVEKYQPIKHRTCKPCSILCGHTGTYKDGVFQLPEYESNALLGSNLEIFDSDVIKQFNHLCGELGMDTISTGSILGWLMEAGEKGLINTNLRFGSPDHIEETITKIAYRQEEGDEYANGTRWLANKYGGKEFAIQVKGLEMAAYDPRGSWGQGLAYAVSNKGADHLTATMFTIEAYMNFMNRYSTRSKADFVIFFENFFAALNSLQTCLFTSHAYVQESLVARLTPKFQMRLFMTYLPTITIQLMDIGIFSGFYEAVTGIKMSQRKFLKAGRRIYTLERYMNTLEGISRQDDTLPERFLKEGRVSDPKGYTVPLEKMLDSYYKKRGYDSNGIPTEKTLKKLKII